MFGRRKLRDTLLNHIFNALSIGVQYTLSFQLTNFGLKCLIYVLSRLVVPKSEELSSTRVKKLNNYTIYKFLMKL